MRRFLKITIFLLGGKVSLFAQTAVIPLYPNAAPGSKPTPSDYVEHTGNGWTTKVSQPTLTPFFPPDGKASGAAIIVIPGGGYAGLAVNHEGAEVAKRFAEVGITAFLLKYRLPSDLIMRDRSIGPLQDAQRALELVRSRASEWKLDTSKVGVIGFSAGGHLASTLGTHYTKSHIGKSNVSLRPSFMMLIYPVISMGEFTHGGSKENLIGKDAFQQQIDLFSNEKQLRQDTPPVFILHAQDDKVVHVNNSLLFYQEVLKHGGKAEMHLFQAGGHGFGLNNKAGGQWFESSLNWLRINKFF
ncbi:alpha/beta hydrolase [Pedobacter sp. SYSU D00535]|uniref:alpha/beta hydrolase n=1 Tax=Pedobacter sp. SYSU D00535 TaxID=2810308 RepID=UPI001A974C4A|nr:alpha/beta hydrolase [Pedobacter sp. SYSU D00535]